MYTARKSQEAKELVIFFLKQFPHYYTKLPFEMYIKFLVAHSIRAMIFGVAKHGDPENLVALLRDFHDQSFIGDEEVLQILYFLSKYLNTSECSALPVLVTFVESFKSVFLRCFEADEKEKLIRVGMTIKSEMEKKDAQSSTIMSLKQVLKSLNIERDLITAKIDNEKVSDAFKSFVQKILNGEIVGDEIPLQNYEAEVEYFLKYALENVENAVTFANRLPSLFHADPCSAYLFRTLLVTNVSTRLLKQHNTATREDFTENESKATCRFIVELLCSNYWSQDEIEKSMLMIHKKFKESERSVGCVALLLIIIEFKLQADTKEYKKER